MPRLIPYRLAAACALALILAAFTAASAIAKGPLVNLRVVSTGGKALAEKTLAAGTATAKTSPQATCFGKGTGGSGKSVTIQGATALGVLIQAAKSTPALRPVLLTDYFSFGLGLCGVGGYVSHGEGSWYLKVNHENPEIGGEAVKLHGGDEVLWYLASTYPYPDELALEAPHAVRAGVPFTVQAFSYDDKGKRKPAAGVKVTGASAQTGADGRTTLTLKRPARLIARDDEDIPSNQEAVCVGGKCPR
jgi:hypothetical protein